MKVIVAVDEKWGIGKKNDLLFSIPLDMKFFREKTSGHVVVMGSNTLKSFPGGNPLKNRTNIVLYPGGEKRDDCIICDSMEELKEELKKRANEEIFVVGGAMFYHTMLPYCDTAYITKVEKDGGAEVFFDNLDKMDNWELDYTSEKMESNGLTITFNTYVNTDVKPL